MSKPESINAEPSEETSKNNVEIPFFFDTRAAVRTSFLRLFMYVSEESLFKILKSGLLKLSLPWNTNDVTECVAQHSSSQSEGVKSFGYLCFSANPHSPAMWGLYADRSRGACLAFDFEIEDQENTPHKVYNILDKGTRFYSSKRIRPIEYTEDRLEPVAKEEENYDISFFFRKSNEWSHEREYRILYRLGLDNAVTIGREEGVPVPRFYVSGMLSHLSAILLGTRFPYQIEEVKALMKEHVNDSGFENLGYSDNFVRVMKVKFGDKSFAFDSDINFKPYIRATLNDKHLDYFLSSSWKKKRVENGNDFIALTGSDYQLDYIYCIRYNEDEEYYIARKKSKEDELELSLFRKKKDGEIGVISVVHPNLLEKIFQNAMASAIANGTQTQASLRTIPPEHAEEISRMANIIQAENTFYSNE